MKSLKLTYYIFHTRATFSASKNKKIGMKKINEEENEDFFELEYFSFQSPNLGEN